MPGIAKLFLSVIADQKRADAATPGLFRAGEAADHEFLARDAFRFEPIRAAAGAVGLLGTFGDDAFERQLAGMLEDLGAFGFEMLGIADGAELRRTGEEIAQCRFAIDQCRLLQIPAVAM